MICNNNRVLLTLIHTTPPYPPLLLEYGEVLYDIAYFLIRSESGIEVAADFAYMLFPLFANKVGWHGYKYSLVSDGP